VVLVIGISVVVVLDVVVVLEVVVGSGSVVVGATVVSVTTGAIAVRLASLEHALRTPDSATAPARTTAHEGRAISVVRRDGVAVG
jgi:hypothetical protein